MVRIIGGAGRGRRLKTAPGDRTRPTAARVRQSLFDVLAREIPGCRFLDAFAGSGGVGLEALSRGAAEVVLVDRSAAAVEAARENARALASAGGSVQVFRQEAQTALPALADRGLRFDVVYLDPPYESQLYQSLIQLAGDRLLAEGGVAVAEHFKKRALPETIGALARTRLLRVGDHCLSFYRRRGEAAAAGAGENDTDEDQAP
ncbi:MAG TPA: 16S rRNA (guanine(966)-N(2))-methyltransferase RsmD [Vicinamibacteria bacterium]|nr:16S rRNA (guanine(966)-N(2))-methyltransferase RsmD [Vicinamibacteria bacterium]